jgi:hypothetical protein
LAFKPPLILSRPQLSPAPFAARFSYSDADERNYVVQTVKLAANDRTRIHFLEDDDGDSYGFVALSLAVFENKPSLIIDYMFTSLQYRGLGFPEIGGKISDFFIGYSIQIASTLRQPVPLRFIALQAATPELEVFYGKRDFMKLDSTHWMFLRF